MDLQNVKNITITEGSVNNIHDQDGKLLWGRLAYDTKYAGDTFQKTYTGKNLLPYPYYDSTNTSEDITYTVNSDGTITVNGTWANAGTASSFLLFNTPNTLTLPAGTYYFPNQPSQIGVVLYDGSSFRNFTAANGYKLTLTEDTPVRRIYLQVNQVIPTQSFNNVTFYPMLTTMANPTIADYEPYTGSTPTSLSPAPNPDYPQDINVVTGEQTVNITGKNLFGIGYLRSTTNGTATISDGIITLIPNGTGNPTVRLELIKPLPAGTYTLNSSTYLSVTTQLRNETDSTTIYNFSSNYQNVTFTTTDEAPMIRFNFVNPGNTNPIYIDLSTLQIEAGSTATSYEPYQSQSYTVDLDTIELCKIGTYQDYIYKSGDDWYVHKEIGDVTYTGGAGENWTNAGTTTTGQKRLVNTDIASVVKTPLNNNVVADILCSYFTPVTAAQTYSSVQGISIQGSGSGIGTLYIYDSSNPSGDVSTFKTWLSTHNMTVYYALATPTNTKITDADLISELEDIHQFLTRYGYNSQITGNLPMIISKENLT